MQDWAMLASGKSPIREWYISGGKIDNLFQQIIQPRTTAIGEIRHGRNAWNLRIGSEHLREERGIEGRARPL
jgi:hypothetical protein